MFARRPSLADPAVASGALVDGNGPRSAVVAAVAAAYGWPADISDDEALAKLFVLNRWRAGVRAAHGEVFRAI
jgi:hypothetical protein